ncbi:MAG: hypothetical protein KAY32_15280 [Candidatus Eisenbacteria sp.]|nr:hypothetical protein [Candidatus Eisenbacteria bacterium]
MDRRTAWDGGMNRASMAAGRVPALLRRRQSPGSGRPVPRSPRRTATPRAALAAGLLVLVLLAAGVSLLPVRAAADGRGDPLDPKTAIHELLYAERFDAILAAASALDSVDLPLERQVEILRGAAAVHLLRSLRKPNPADEEAARAAMRTMLALDPRADFVPGYRYPVKVHELFGEVHRAWMETRAHPADPTRIAVAPFYLIDLGAGERFDWQAFADALTFIVTTDLEVVPGLVLLSREHMDAIRSELSLASESDLVSAKNRIRLQELLSASSFIYGEVQALPGDEIWLELRWVATETGATLLARHGARRVRHGRDLLDLEREVVVDDFIPAMISALGLAAGEPGAARAREHFARKLSLAAGGDTYLRYLASVSAAAEAETDGNIELAIDYWRAASEALPGYAAPHERLEALRLQQAYAPQSDEAAQPNND